MENYMVNVSARRARPSTTEAGDEAEVEELSFNLKDFQINREVGGLFPRGKNRSYPTGHTTLIQR